MFYYTNGSLRGVSGQAKPSVSKNVMSTMTIEETPSKVRLDCLIGSCNCSLHRFL
jgi:hypothetical protein